MLTSKKYLTDRPNHLLTANQTQPLIPQMPTETATTQYQ